MPVSELSASYGTVTLDPDGDVAAGSHGTWRVTYTAGSRGVAAGGRIRIYTDSDTDRGICQLDDPAAPDYTTLGAPRPAQAVILVQKYDVVVAMGGEGLKPGKQVTVTYGDRSGGGPGFRSQTFLEAQHYFWVDVSAERHAGPISLPDPPYLTIVGGEAELLAVVAPSKVAVGKSFRVLVKAEDKWGNPAAAYRGTVELRAEGLELPEHRLTFTPGDNGVRWVDGCTASRAGLIRIAAADAQGGLSVLSNPIACTGQPGKYQLLWGDFHGGQIALAEKIPDFFRYARDVAGISFAGYQRNDHAISKDDWALQQRTERAFYDPGRFVPVPGYEWSPPSERGGHHNLFFRRYDQPIRRCDHSRLADKSDDDTDLHDIRDLYRHYRMADVVITPHVGGVASDLSSHEPTLEPAIEVTSTHGSFEWFLKEALERRYKVGFLGGSDSFTGRPGGDRPGYQLRRYAKSGLTAVYAKALTVEGLVEALKARRCYGTTGARILLGVEADGRRMGEEYTTESKAEISVAVTGTAPLESVELFRGRERIYSHFLSTSRSDDRVRILWEGASGKRSYSAAVWEGRLKVTGRKIASVEKVRFDSPRSDIRDEKEDSLSWHSITCGYRSGMILELKGDGDAELQIAIDTSLFTEMASIPAEKIALSVRLQELAAGPKIVEIGELNRKVAVSLAPAPGGAEAAEFTFVDPSPEPGINPYWVRVVQTDMEMAWSSPIFVDYLAPT